MEELRSEVDSLKKLLAFLTDENIQLKERLSWMLKEKSDTSILDEAEIFQTSFIRQDDRIGILKNSVAQLDKLVAREAFDDGKIARETGRKLGHLREQISDAQTKFNKLKSAFDSYLSENLI